jgi:pimeloyl-ACP methyl ester carboxylesterase
MTVALGTNFPLKSLIAVDIAPKPQYDLMNEPQKSSFYQYIQKMKLIEALKLSSKQKIDLILQQIEPNSAIRQFLMTNLIWQSPTRQDYFIFRNNLDVLEASLPNFFNFPSQSTFTSTSTSASLKSHVPTLFIRGSESSYLTDSDIPDTLLTFPNSTVQSIQGGHWLHAENPNDFLSTLNSFLFSSQQNV